MKTTLHTDWTVGDICKGFIYDKNEGKGLFGLGGKLIIQPEYQRNYNQMSIYDTETGNTIMNKFYYDDEANPIKWEE